MGKRFAIVIGVAALGAALIAVGASADFRSVHDPRGDVKCTKKPCPDSMRRNADIVRATAGHDGTRLKHTIRVVGTFQHASLQINTDSDGTCEWYLIAKRGVGVARFRKCFSGTRTGRARLEFHRHSVEILFNKSFFSKSSVGNPSSYGWIAFTLLPSPGAARRAEDLVPNRAAHIGDEPDASRFIPHELG
jgi:hypothetical protein